MMACSTNTRSSLELMLDSIRQRDERPDDVAPALPLRPVSKARLPPGRRKVPLRLQMSCSIKGPKENEADNKEGTDADFVLAKITSLSFKDDTRERPIEKILEIQKSFRGRQVRCYYLQLKRGTITLQSFVRGETARKNYQFLSRRLEAVIVIQRHTKQLLDMKIMEKRQNAAIILQSAIRGWLARKNIHYREKLRLPGNDYREDLRKPDRMSSKYTVSPSALADLQTRLLIVERELENKEEENASIRRRLCQYDEKWLEYEKKMKAMEKKWQDQLASLQMSLLAAKNTLANERTRDRLGNFIPISTHDCDSPKTMPIETQTNRAKTVSDIVNLHTVNEAQLRNNGVEDTYVCIEANRSFNDDSRKNTDEEFRNLKIRFEIWRKDYKVRLQEAKKMLQKVGHSETKKSGKKWWKR